MDLYSKNLNYFKNVANLVYDTILNEDSRYNSNITYMEEYGTILAENNNSKCFIHSIYNKEREVEALLKDIEDDTELLIIYGFGCCVSANKIKEKFNKIENIVFIEPDLNLFREIIKRVDVEKTLNLFYGKNVTYIINKTPEEACGIIFSMFLNKVNKKVSLIYNLSYRSLYENYFESFTEEFVKSIKKFRLNVNTQVALIYEEVRNVFTNIFEDSIPIERFKNKFQGIPAIIVAGGPSLNKNMDYLRKLKNKALIIAAGNGIKILHENGIVPHFRIAYDPSEIEYKIFENIDTEAAPLIYTDRLYYECVTKYKGRKVSFLNSVEFFSQFIRKKMNNEGFIVDSGFTIVAPTLDMLIKIGINKIIFMGQDLSYSENAMYAKGSIYDNTIMVDFEQNGYKKMKGIDGGTVYTHDGFLGMKYNLEDRIKLYPENTYINATEGGLNIEGTRIKTMEQVATEDLTKEFNIEEIINNEFSKKDIKDTESLHKAIREFIDDLDELDKINNDRLKYIDKIAKNKNKGHKASRLLNDMRYLSSNKSKVLEKNKLYDEVINPSISNILYAIYWTFSYDGSDKEKEIEAELRVNTNISLEIKKLIEFVRYMLKENFKEYSEFDKIDNDN